MIFQERTFSFDGVFSIMLILEAKRRTMKRSLHHAWNQEPAIHMVNKLHCYWGWFYRLRVLPVSISSMFLSYLTISFIIFPLIIWKETGHPGWTLDPGSVPECALDWWQSWSTLPTARGASRFETAVAENLPIAYLLYLMCTLPQYKAWNSHLSVAQNSRATKLNLAIHAILILHMASFCNVVTCNHNDLSCF